MIKYIFTFLLCIFMSNGVISAQNGVYTIKAPDEWQIYSKAQVDSLNCTDKIFRIEAPSFYDYYIFLKSNKEFFAMPHLFIAHKEGLRITDSEINAIMKYNYTFDKSTSSLWSVKDSGISAIYLTSNGNITITASSSKHEFSKYRPQFEQIIKSISIANIYKYDFSSEVKPSVDEVISNDKSFIFVLIILTGVLILSLIAVIFLLFRNKLGMVKNIFSLKTVFMAIKENIKSYKIFNLIAYGVIFLGILFAFLFPAAQKSALLVLKDIFSKGHLAFVLDSYLKNNFFAAVSFTFINNIIASLRSFTLIQFILPFIGLFISLFQFFIIGFLASPANNAISAGHFILHTPVMLIEMQAYILAVWGVFLFWKNIIFIKSSEFANRKEAAIKGIALIARLYILIAIILAVAAIYEAFEIIVLYKIVQ